MLRNRRGQLSKSSNLIGEEDRTIRHCWLCSNKTMMKQKEVEQPLLLKKQYHENCPGCKVDQAKDLKEDVTIWNLLSIWMVVLCNSLPIASLYPYIYFMVEDFNVAKREEDVSAYAGYVGSAYMLGRALTSVLWGIIADRYGRKPVIISGVISVIIFSTLFGLSTNFWMAVLMRFVLGSLNGLLVPMMAYCTEIFREEKQALGLSTFSAAWGIGLVLGPALGGYLAQPTLKYPHLFPSDSFWDKFPYFLPSFTISAFSLAVLIACIWFPETLHNHPPSDESNEETEALETGKSGTDKEKIIQKDGNLLLNFPLMSSIIVYCIFSLHDSAYQEIFSLWAVSPQRLGGLSFSTDHVGNILTITGTGLMIYQISLYPSLQKACGTVRIALITGVLSIPLLQSYPFIAMLSGILLNLVISIASVLKNILTMSIITSLFLLVNGAVEQHQRGAANGIAMTSMSVFKAIGPAGGGAILTWSQKRIDASFLPGAHMVFFILNVVAGCGLLLMCTPFLRVKKKTPSEPFSEASPVH